jgi:hypothetical protein
MSVTETQLRREVKVRPLWEVTCELERCNGNADEGEIYDSRAEADAWRLNHIRMHLEGQFS